MPGLEPEEVIFITSRSLVVDQQSRQDGVLKFNIHEDIPVIELWNGGDPGEEALEGIGEGGIRIMTYDKIVRLLSDYNPVGSDALINAKVVVFDECHTLFSDSFIKNIAGLKIWIRDTLFKGNKYIIGMTATADVMYKYNSSWQFPFKQLNKKPLMRYVAKKMTVTNYDTIPYLVATERLPGKTLILCDSVFRCFDLQRKLPNAAVLISRNHKSYIPEMDMIRDYIAKYGTLPDTYQVRDAAGKVRREELRTLIVTTTAREGYSLKKESGVRNVISCLSDPMHLTQICGRARYGLDNIVVADTFVRWNNLTSQGDYFHEQRGLFKDFIKDRAKIRWFSGVAHLVEHDVYGVRRFVLGSDEARFIQYINEKWLVPHNASKEVLKKCRIWRDEDKQEIVDVFNQCKILSTPPSEVKFLTVIRVMESVLGYHIVSNIMKKDNQRYTYKLVVSFNEDEMDYHKAVEPIIDDDDRIAS